MQPLTEAEEAEDEHIHACVEAIAKGDLAIAAVAHGEAVDPAARDRAANAMAEILASPIDGAIWTAADVARTRGLRALLTAAAPSPEARAAAAACRPIFTEDA